MATSKEKTFTSFTPEQAAKYAADRGFSYSPGLYQRILEFHGSRARDVILDVGTGPGKVVFDFLPFFSRGLGCDASVQMIEQAKKDAVQRGFGDRTGWAVAGGENCGEVLAGEQVDLITVATAAHWFEMEEFYASAAKLLKPGGTLAMWTLTSYYAHPGMKHGKEVDRILHELEDDMLGPYTTPGNQLSRQAYETLPLPWSFANTQGLFEEAAFERVDWDRDGVPSAPALADGTPGPFFYGHKVPLDRFVRGFGSSSMVIRWREAHPGKGETEEDPVYITFNKLKEVLDEDEDLVLGTWVPLLLLRRAS